MYLHGIKARVKEIPEANVMHLASGHSHLALCKPVVLFQLSFNGEIYSFIAC